LTLDILTRLESDVDPMTTVSHEEFEQLRDGDSYYWIFELTIEEKECKNAKKNTKDEKDKTEDEKTEQNSESESSNYPYFLDIKCWIDKNQVPINTSILKNYKEKTVYILIKETGESKNIYFKAHYAVKIMGKEEVGDSNQNETPGRRNKVINILSGKKK